MPMRQLLGWLCLLALCLTWPAQAQDQDGEISSGRKFALVIGNNEYKHLPKLVTAVSDAEAVAALMRDRYGFETMLLKNASRMKILLALNHMRADLEENDSLLIYYAGHGTLERQTQTGYWLPVDAEEDNDINWIANADLTRRLRGMSARHVMVVADSCYSGTLVRSVEVQPATGYDELALLRRLAQKRSRTAIVSGGLEPVVDSGRGGHSVFANAFLGVLSDNDEPLHGGTLFDKLRRRVVLNADQTPQYSDIRLADHEGGSFVLVPKGWRPGGRAPAPPETAQPELPPEQATPSLSVDNPDLTAEIAFWESIKDQQHPAVYQAYLQQFPDGTFAPLARLRMRELEGGSSASPGRQAPVLRPSGAIEAFSAVMVTSANANIRSEPSLDGQRVATLQRGSEVSVTGRVNGGEWYELRGQSFGTAYIYGKLLVTPEVWAAQRQPAARPNSSGARQAALSPPAADTDRGPGVRFINSTGRNVAASTKALVLEVVQQTLDPNLWRRLSSVNITLTEFGIDRRQNPELFGQQLVKSLFGNLVPSTESQYVHVHTVEVNITAVGRNGGQFSDSARTEQHDFTDRNQVNILLNTLLETARRAGGRISIRMAGGTPPDSTRQVVLGKHKAYYQQ